MAALDVRIVTQQAEATVLEQFCSLVEGRSMGAYTWECMGSCKTGEVYAAACRSLQEWEEAI